jgi:hypothetical protein
MLILAADYTWAVMLHHAVWNARVEIDGSAVRKCNHFATQCHKLTLAAYLYL